MNNTDERDIDLQSEISDQSNKVHTSIIYDVSIVHNIMFKTFYNYTIEYKPMLNWIIEMFKS